MLSGDAIDAHGRRALSEAAFIFEIKPLAQACERERA
jgi:hypothetical protein